MTEHQNHQAQDLINFINLSPSPYHAAANVVETLENAGYQLYDGRSKLDSGDKKYVLRGGSSVFAFSVGKKALKTGFRMVASHTDAPGLKIKPQSLIRQANCLCLNTEVYGGPILHTWFDRTLSMAGQVALKTGDVWKPDIRLINFIRPVLLIPSLAIHMHRDVNEVNAIQKAKSLLPVIGLDSYQDSDCNQKIDDSIDAVKEKGTGLHYSSPNDFESILAHEMGVAKDDILDYSLFLFDTAPACLAGLNQELISAPRLDNLGMVHASMNALLEADEQDGINLIACFDHEEIGSRTRQGASSSALRDIMESIIYGLGGNRTDFLSCMDTSFLLSADQAHAVHPNYQEAADQTNQPKINQGPVLKTSASQSYLTDARSMATFRQLCREADVTCQVFAARSDKRSGSTVGPLTVEKVPVCGVDIGNPIWAMHAIRETGGAADQEAMIKVMKQFFS